MCDVVSASWSVLFPYLKVLELGDIFILAIQKRRVTVFVWTHHFFALIASWYMYPYYPSIGLWYIVTISIPHILIYAYLFFKELDIRMSNVIPSIILLVELITQFLGSVISTLALSFIMKGKSCTLPSTFILLIDAVWIICVVLCAVFFYSQCKKYQRAESQDSQDMVTRL